MKTGVRARSLLIIGMFALLGAGAAMLVLLMSPQPAQPAGPQPTPTLRRLRVDQPAPTFTLATLDGGQVSLASLRGKRVLVNFWASWCAPCLTETPDLVRVYNELKASGQNDIEFIGVGTKDDLENLKQFAASQKIPYPVAFDETDLVGDSYQAFVLPITVFVDAKGNVSRTQLGIITRQQVLDQLAKMETAKQ